MKFHHHHHLHHHHHKHQHQQTPYTISTIKLPILKRGEYDIWAMKMEHYLAHTDYPIWEVIQNGNGPVSITTDTQGQIKVLPPRTAEEIIARERERKARTTLLMALLEDHLAKFHKMTDAKEIWDAIKSKFGGNDESKKMQKYILKQQFEGFFVSNSEGLHKGYDRSLPSAWFQVSLIMRTKPGVDSLSFDDLYNNLRVFENDVKGSTASSSSMQNVAFVSENTSSTNDVSTAYSVSNPSGQNSHTCVGNVYSVWDSQVVSEPVPKSSESIEIHGAGGFVKKEDKSAPDYLVLPIWSSYSSTVKRSTTKDAGKAPNNHPDLKTDEKPVDKEDQVFLDELERLKRQEKDANDAAEALRKEFAQETENLLIQVGAAKASSTNIVNTVSIPVSTVSIPVSTVSPYDGLSLSDPTNPEQDDFKITCT
ncbi:hypothetical protein Tco_1105305 [Tanacetum coccineum]